MHRDSARQPTSPREVVLSANKTIGWRILVDVWGEGDLAVVDELVAPNYIDHAPRGPEPSRVQGPEGLKDAVRLFRAAFPELTYRVDFQVAEGDLVATRFTATGTQRGPGGGGSEPVGPFPGSLAPPDQLLLVPFAIHGIGFLDRGPCELPAASQQLTEQTEVQLGLPPRRIEAIAESVGQPVAASSERRLAGDRRPNAEVPVEQGHAWFGVAPNADVGAARVAVIDRMRAAGQRGAGGAGSSRSNRTISATACLAFGLRCRDGRHMHAFAEARCNDGLVRAGVTCHTLLVDEA